MKQQRTAGSLRRGIIAALVVILSFVDHGTAKAQTRANGGKEAFASLEGDIYLITQSGDVKLGAANTVYVLTDSALTIVRAESKRDGQPEAVQLRAKRLRLDSLTSFTDSVYKVFKASEPAGGSPSTYWFRQEAHRKSLADSIRADSQAEASYLTEELRTSRVRTALARNATASSATGIRGHYRFPHLPPDHYYLWAYTTLSGNTYDWWADVVLHVGDRVVLDLDNFKIDGSVVPGIKSP